MQEDRPVYSDHSVPRIPEREMEMVTDIVEAALEWYFYQHHDTAPIYCLRKAEVELNRAIRMLYEHRAWT